MHRTLIVITVLILAGCASSPNEKPPAEDLVTVGSQDGRTIMIPLRRDDFVEGGVVAAPRQAVWSRLPAVYEELGLPEPAVDRSIWTVAVQNHTIMRRVGSEAMSRLIDCGRSMTGPNADSHRIRLSVRTWLEPSDDGTEVRTRVEAVAIPIDGRAGSFACSSRGRLEMLIAQALSTGFTS